MVAHQSHTYEKVTDSNIQKNSSTENRSHVFARRTRWKLLVGRQLAELGDGRRDGRRKTTGDRKKRRFCLRLSALKMELVQLMANKSRQQPSFSHYMMQCVIANLTRDQIKLAGVTS